MKKNIAIALLSTALLSALLVGCGDDTNEMLQERVTSGKHAGDVVDKARDLNQQQSDQVDEYFE